MRSHFDNELKRLHTELTAMGILCEQVIALAAKALTTGDSELAKQVARPDTEIDQKERDIEAICLKLLLQQQPVARDLRQISAALKMITDMERIGDQAEDIAEIIPFLQGRTGTECADIALMAESAIRMVTGSVQAYIKQDEAGALAVIKEDDVVDDAFDRVKTSLITMLKDPAADGEYALDLLMIAKYFERIGDHATNIAEWVLFSITGKHE